MIAHAAVVAGVPMRWLSGASRPAPTGAGTGAGTSTAPVTILLHGFPTSAELWRGVLPAISAGPAVAWELVGYGGSIPAGRGRDISVTRQADYLLAWLRHHGLSRVVLAGHDLGGGIAQILAIREPGLVAGLLLTNCIAYRAWPVGPVRLLAACGPVLRRAPNPAWRPVYRRVIEGMHPDPAVGRESARTHWAHYGRHHAGEALVRQARSLRAGDTAAVANRLGDLDLPARVLWGDADPFLAMGVAARLARDMGTAIQALPGAGHFTPEDRPQAVARAVDDLVRDAATAPLDGGPTRS